MNSDLDHAVALTQKMLEAANLAQWQQLFQMSSLRQKSLEAAFKNGVQQESEATEIQGILKIDAEIQAIIQNNKATLLGELKQTRHQVKANNLYQNIYDNIASQKE